jgi:hypothetical protein
VTTAELSVVIPSVNGWADLEGCLIALERERAQAVLEVLVADRCGSAVRAKVRARYRWVRLLEAAPGTSIPDLRAMAIGRATAPSVAVIEDHVLVPSGWARALLRARESARVVGGGVRNAATSRLVDWAAFLCEYSHLLPPLEGGEVTWLTGNNTVYDRALLEQHRTALEAGRWENHLHDVLRKDGIALVCRPEIVVDHKKHYSIGEYLSQRYLYARSYAGARVAESVRWRRIAYGAAAFLLPPIVLWRSLTRARAKRVDRHIVTRTAPLIALFALAWGAGEVVGYWFGPGDALRKVC